jgi:hypothetical protein
VKIRVVCTQVMSFIVGHGCQVWSVDPADCSTKKEVRHQASFEMADQESGHGSISVRVADEHELAKWVPGMEYDLLIEGTSLVAADELNDDGIIGMYTDPPQPIESAGGGVQPCEPLRPVEEYDFVTGTWGPPKGVPPLPVPADMNVDADE